MREVPDFGERGVGDPLQPRQCRPKRDGVSPLRAHSDMGGRQGEPPQSDLICHANKAVGDAGQFGEAAFGVEHLDLQDAAGDIFHRSADDLLCRRLVARSEEAREWTGIERKLVPRPQQRDGDLMLDYRGQVWKPILHRCDLGDPWFTTSIGGPEKSLEIGRNAFYAARQNKRRDNERRAIEARSVPNYPVRRDHGWRKMSSGRAPEIGKKSSFGGRRLDILRIGFESPPEAKDAARTRALEQQAVLVLPENPMIFSAMADGRLSPHGPWTEIDGAGS